MLRRQVPGGAATYRRSAFQDEQGFDGDDAPPQARSAHPIHDGTNNHAACATDHRHTGQRPDSQRADDSHCRTGRAVPWLLGPSPAGALALSDRGHRPPQTYRDRTHRRPIRRCQPGALGSSMNAVNELGGGAEHLRDQLTAVRSALAQHTPIRLMCTCGRPNPCSVRQRFDERRVQLLTAMAVLDQTHELPQLRPLTRAESKPGLRRLGRPLQRIPALWSRRHNR